MCIMIFCMPVPHCIQMVPLFLPPLPLKHPEYATGYLSAFLWKSGDFFTTMTKPYSSLSLVNYSSHLINGVMTQIRSKRHLGLSGTRELKKTKKKTYSTDHRYPNNHLSHLRRKKKKEKKIRTSSSPVSPQERQRLGESGGGRRCFAVKPHQRCFEATSSHSLSSGSRTHARTHIRARTHTPRRRRRFASCGRAHDMKPVTQTHMWWQSDVPSPSSPRPPLPPQINQRATCTPESLGSWCLNEDIAAMVKDKAEDRTLQYQQTLVSFGWGHRWRLASCVGAWRDFFFFYGCRCRAGEDAAAGCSSASCVRTGGGCVWLLSSILTCCLYWLCFSIFVLLPFLHLDPQVLRHSQPLAWPHLRN